MHHKLLILFLLLLSQWLYSTDTIESLITERQKDLEKSIGELDVEYASRIKEYPVLQQEPWETDREFQQRTEKELGPENTWYKKQKAHLKSKMTNEYSITIEGKTIVTLKPFDKEAKAFRLGLSLPSTSLTMQIPFNVHIGQGSSSSIGDRFRAVEKALLDKNLSMELLFTFDGSTEGELLIDTLRLSENIMLENPGIDIETDSSHLTYYVSSKKGSLVLEKAKVPTWTTGKLEKTILKILAYGDNSTAEGKSITRIINEFARLHPELTIESEVLYDDAYHHKARARIASNDYPDIMYLWAGPRSNYVYESGLNIDMNKYLDPGKYDVKKLLPMEAKGEQWYIPIGAPNTTSVLFANTELLAQLDLTLPETYEDLVAMVPVAQEHGLEVISFAGAESWVWNSCLFSTLVGRYTHPNFASSAVKGTESFDEEGMIQALGMMKKMVDDGVFGEKVMVTDYGVSVANFIGEKALFTLDGQWQVGAFEDPKFQAKVRMMDLPIMPDEVTHVSSAADISTGYGIIKAGTRNPAVFNAGLAFLDFLNQPTYTLQRWKDVAIAYPILKNLPVPTDLDTISQEKARYYKAGSNYTEVLDAFIPPGPNNVLNDGIGELLRGTITAEEVAEALEAELSRYRR